MRRFLFLFFFSLTFLISGTEESHALGQGGLSVSPVFQEVVFDAGDERAEFSVTLKNETEETMTLRPSVVDFGSLDESGGVAFLGQSENLDHRYALASWMQPEKDAIFLDPGETEELHMVIENREALSPGGHYGAVLFQIGGEGGSFEKENQVAVQQMASVLVFAKKQGGEVYHLELGGEIWPKSLFRAPSRLELHFQNSGNVHVVPRGLAVLEDPLGRKIAKGVINQESGFLLPETIRTYPVTLQSLLPAFIPGKYILTVQFRYDGTETFQSQTIERILFPWPGILLGVFLGGFAFLAMRLRKKWRLSGIKK